MNVLHLNQFIKVLNNFDWIMEKAAGHADSRKFDVNQFMTARISPDMWPLAMQIRMVCHYSMEAAGTLSNNKPPQFEEPKTWSELRQKIAKTSEYLKSLQHPDYTRIQEIKVAPVWANGMWLTGEESFYEFILPNFYFHATTAYNILRGAGVELGKSDFMGKLNFKKPE